MPRGIAICDRIQGVGSWIAQPVIADQTGLRDAWLLWATASEFLPIGWKRRVAACPSAGQLALPARSQRSTRGGHRQPATMPQARQGGQWDRVWAVLKVLTGLALLFLSVRNIDWRSLPRALAAASPGWLTLALVTVLLGLALRILRWRVLLALADDVPALPAVSEAYLAGKAANTLMPFLT